MPAITQATTPQLTLLIPGVFLEEEPVSRLDVYIASENKTLVIDAFDQRSSFYDSDKGLLIMCRLTQEETLSLQGDKTVEVQVRWQRVADIDNLVEATDIAKLDVKRILYPHTIHVSGGR